jgi:hypothetical protein
MKKRYLAIALLTPPVIVATTLLTVSTANAQSVTAYKTTQGQVIVTGLKPGKLNGVAANTGKGFGVSNITSTACGEVIINKAADFKFIIVNRQKINPKSLPVKTYTACTKSLPPSPKTPIKPR